MKMNKFDPTMSGAFSGTALKETINRLQDELKKQDENIATLITTEEGDGVWVTKDGYVLAIDKFNYYPKSAEIIKPTNTENYLENDIEALKKKIKHSKNPMEKKIF